MRTLITLALGCLFTASPALAEEIRFARYPHTSHGRIAFSYHGDIWIANLDGTDPRRLTAHVARDVQPRFSPDGQWIAFSSNRWGNDDVFVIPIEGGEPRQLTWHSGDDVVQYWTPDGQGIVIATSRGAYPWGSPLHIVRLDGSLPEPLPMDMGSAGMIRQDGALLAFNRLGFRYWRKGYRGNNSTDIDVVDLRTKEFRQLTDANLEGYASFTQDALPMWGADGMIYFLSERGGAFNLWRIDPAGGEPGQVTNHTEDGVQHPAISPDGRTIVYENDFQLWSLDVPDGEPRRIPVDLRFDPKENTVDHVTAGGVAQGFTPSPDGNRVAVDYHGEIVIIPTDETVGEKTGVTRSPWRDRYAVWSPDGARIAYVSDESREEEIWVYEIASGDRRKLTTQASYKASPVWSPGSDRLAFVATNRIFEIDVASGVVSELANNPASGYQGVTYSPDGRWLTYARSDDNLDSEVYALEIAARREVNISRNPFRDRNPQFSPDGSTIVVLSNRDGGTDQLYSISLVRRTEDPDDPLVRARLAEERDSTSRTADQAVRIDTAGLEHRPVRLTSGTEAAGDFFFSSDGRTIYFTSRDDDGEGLFSVTSRGEKRRRITAGSFDDLTATTDRAAVFYSESEGGGRGGRGGGGGGVAGSEIWRMTLNDQRKERIDFSFQVEVDRRAEWEQILEESWRVMKYRFYDEKMHGVDWDAVRARYRPLLDYAGSNEDVYDLANEMIGELNASHTGVSGPPSHMIDQPYTMRQLGFELEAADGRYRIAHIYRNGPADREWLGLAVGDYVIEIDGQELRAGDNYWRILNHALNEYVPVRVAKTAAGSDARTVRIRSLESISDLRYEEWVENNRAFVERESNDQIAYVHIRAMNQPSLERFQNEIDRFWNRKGIVVDIRFNGGGNIDQQLIDILERRPYEYWNNRWASRTAGRRPRQAIAGPKVMLINWRSASDSEVTPQAFRDLGLGRIVGNPTSAAVIATGNYSLINGGSIRTPGSLVVTYDPEKPNNFGTNLENFGVAPDVWVKNGPADVLAGNDRELRAALDEVLRMLGEGKWQFTTTPNSGGVRNRAP
ncbi:MAG: S41 family peptidase [Longimicrobiales bacterium]